MSGKKIHNVCLPSVEYVMQYVPAQGPLAMLREFYLETACFQNDVTANAEIHELDPLLDATWLICNMQLLINCRKT